MTFECDRDSVLMMGRFEAFQQMAKLLFVFFFSCSCHLDSIRWYSRPLAARFSSADGALYCAKEEQSEQKFRLEQGTNNVGTLEIYCDAATWDATIRVLLISIHLEKSS